MKTRIEGTFQALNKTWHYRWLDEERTRLSVLQYNPDRDGSGNDQTEWPTDVEIGRACGAPVKFSDAGDHPDAVEAIYHRTENRLA